jgi:hypothetical protein
MANLQDLSWLTSGMVFSEHSVEGSPIKLSLGEEGGRKKAGDSN